MARRLFSKPIHAKGERNGPPSADQGLSTAKTRSIHVTWAQGWKLPTSPCPILSDGAEPKSQGHCRQWHHKLKVVWRIYASIPYNRLKVEYRRAEWQNNRITFWCFVHCWHSTCNHQLLSNKIAEPGLVDELQIPGKPCWRCWDSCQLRNVVLEWTE